MIRNERQTLLSENLVGKFLLSKNRASFIKFGNFPSGLMQIHGQISYDTSHCMFADIDENDDFSIWVATPFCIISLGIINLVILPFTYTRQGQTLLSENLAGKFSLSKNRASFIKFGNFSIGNTDNPDYSQLTYVLHDETLLRPCE